MRLYRDYMGREMDYMGLYRDYIGVYGDHKGYMECKVSIEDLMEYQMEGSRVLAERARSSPSKDGDI